MINKVTNIHGDIKRKLEEFAPMYKLNTDKHIRYKSFDEGDNMIVHLRKERIAIGEYNKLKQKKIKSFHIFQNINYNAYVINHPNTFVISKIFNIQDLHDYYGLEPLSSF